MRQGIVKQIVVFCLLVAIIVLGRLLIAIPNVAPVAAIALFGAYYFRSIAVGFLAAITGMIISDLVFLPLYNTQSMAVNYLGLSFMAIWGVWLHKGFPASGVLKNVSPITRKWLSILAVVPFGSLVFFLASNFMVWYAGDLYADTATGLMLCYEMGLPFLKYTLAGDFIFTVVLFGSYFLVSEPSSVVVLRTNVSSKG